MVACRMEVLVDDCCQRIKEINHVTLLPVFKKYEVGASDLNIS